MSNYFCGFLLLSYIRACLLSVNLFMLNWIGSLLELKV